jgi:hypothetical protein
MTGAFSDGSAPPLASATRAIDGRMEKRIAVNAN